MANFYPRPPRGGRLRLPWLLARDFLISIHALREEGDLPARARTLLEQNFYPRPPRGGRRVAKAMSEQWGYFYPRPPRGGRLVAVLLHGSASTFLSTPSARRATQFVPLIAVSVKDFYPRPPRGGRRRLRFRLHRGSQHFYPRPPRGGRLRFLTFRKNSVTISIHALREEGDPVGCRNQKRRHTFLSTPSARRATSPNWSS